MSPFPRRIAVALPSGLPCGRPSSTSRFLPSHPPCGWRSVRFPFLRTASLAGDRPSGPYPSAPVLPCGRLSRWSGAFRSNFPCGLLSPLHQAPVFRRSLRFTFVPALRRLRPWRGTLCCRTHPASTGLGLIRRLSTAIRYLSTGKVHFPPLVPRFVHTWRPAHASPTVPSSKRSTNAKRSTARRRSRVTCLTGCPRTMRPATAKAGGTPRSFFTASS